MYNLATIEKIVVNGAPDADHNIPVTVHFVSGETEDKVVHESQAKQFDVLAQHVSLKIVHEGQSQGEQPAPEQPQQ